MCLTIGLEILNSLTRLHNTHEPLTHKRNWPLSFSKNAILHHKTSNQVKFHSSLQKLSALTHQSTKIQHFYSQNFKKIKVNSYICPSFNFLPICLDLLKLWKGLGIHWILWECWDLCRLNKFELNFGLYSLFMHLMCLIKCSSELFY